MIVPESSSSIRRVESEEVLAWDWNLGPRFGGGSSNAAARLRGQRADHCFELWGIWV